VTVLEAAPWAGGRARTERHGDFILNTGAGFVTDFYDETLALLRELRIDVMQPRERPTIAATALGKLPIDFSSPRGTWRFPLVPWPDKLRAAGTLAAAWLRRRSHIAHLASLARMDRGGTAERWGRRAFGKAGYDYYLRAGLEPFFFFSAREASAALAKALTRHALGWRMLAIRGGTGTLCEALAERLEVRTGCRAGGVETFGDHVAVHHSGGTVEADYGVLAVPAGAAAHLEGNIAPEDRNDLGAVRYAPGAVLYFGYERPITVQHPSVTPMGPGPHPIARVWTLSRWLPEYLPEGKELLAIYASSTRAAELLDRDPDKIVAALRGDAEEIFGRLADPDWVRLYPYREAVVVPVPGHYRRMRAFAARRRKRLLFAGDWLTGSSIEGAVRTGRGAARSIIARAE